MYASHGLNEIPQNPVCVSQVAPVRGFYTRLSSHFSPSAQRKKQLKTSIEHHAGLRQPVSVGIFPRVVSAIAGGELRVTHLGFRASVTLRAKADTASFISGYPNERNEGRF
jgi:hypothetical protein